MTFLCSRCRTVLTTPLQELADSSLFSTECQVEYLPRCFYAVSAGQTEMDIPRGHYVINIEDYLTVRMHRDSRRSIGCCGPSGSHGPNLLCPRGHVVGTLCADCYMPHYIHLLPDSVIADESDPEPTKPVEPTVGGRLFGWCISLLHRG